MVVTGKGILVVSQGGHIFLLPGGGARHHESREEAAKRELKEETGLETASSTFLFAHRGKIHKNGWGDVHKVFLVIARGSPRPRKEIRRVAYYNGRNVRVSRTTDEIIEKYWGMTA